jgi:hypothetical protein
MTNNSSHNTWYLSRIASQPQQEEKHLIISDVYFICVKNRFQYWWLIFTKLLIDFTLVLEKWNWNLPLLQHNKGSIIICMIISSLTSMWLLHIEMCLLGSCITNEKFKFMLYYYSLNWLFHLMVLYEIVNEILNPSTWPILKD